MVARSRRRARTFVQRVGDAVVAERLSGPVVIVLEGQARRGATEGEQNGVEVVHAVGEGDDALAALAGGRPGPVTLVTADRGLSERARMVGAEVVGPLAARSRGLLRGAGCAAG